MTNSQATFTIIKIIKNLELLKKKTYGLKSTVKFWTKVTTNKISRNWVKKLYKEFIRKDIDALKREKK